MRSTTSMVPTNSTEYTTGLFQNNKEYRTAKAFGDRSSIQDALLLYSSNLSPDIVLRLSGSPETRGKRDVNLIKFDQSINTTPTNIFTSSKPNTKIKDLVPLDLCQQFSSCERASNLIFKFCRCDALCTLYNDCCYNADIPENSTISSDLQFECMPFIMDKSVFDVQGYSVVTSCPQDLKDTEIDIKCQSDDIFSFGPFVITDSNIVYKNRFCAKCNNINVYEPFDVIFTHINSTIRKNSNASIVMASLQDTYKKRDLNNLVVEFISPVAENLLRECIVYSDPNIGSETCLNYYISPALARMKGKNFEVDGICLKRFYDKEIFVYASLVSSANLSERMIEEILTVMSWSFSDEISVNTFSFTYNKEWIDNLFQIVNVRIYGKTVEKKSYEEGLIIDNKLDKAQWLIRVSPENGSVFEVNTVVLPRKGRTYKTELSKAIVQNKLDQFKSFVNDSFEKKICAKSVIECEISSDVENPRTVITEFTCVDFIDQQPIVTSTNINMNVITYTGMGISVIALTASLIVYRRLGMHRSIPGSNVEHLTITLLITDIIFMLGMGANDISLVCYSVGVALHYLWLLFFSLTCIASFQMCHNLTDISHTAGDYGEGISPKKPFLTLFGLLLPFLFVVPAVLIDFFEVDDVSIDYSESICFPTGYPGNLIFVSAPIGLTVVINITCLLCIAVVITKQSSGIEHIRRSNSYQYLPVFVCISLVTGMLWIAGLLRGVIQNEEMEYLFVISCSFSGLLIAFGNLTTKRIYRELRKSKQSLSK
ncbi:unnamed protein product [Mytilus edulis]|uniref:G-protein coupled receptors family 2 profile 2 domain-containing protein n=1 Tax=Mytilus edulis TaxID=6550 RepID=A0A8S3T9I1_MYTED|nr:unnamed protein product [Mytilus edulis]